MSIHFVVVEFIELDSDTRNSGTWAGGIRSGRKTVVSELVDLISEEENVYEVLLNGVGSDGSISTKMKGGKSHVSIICQLSTKTFSNHASL